VGLPTLLQFTLGLALLVAGAELLLRGAVRLAGALGISPLVIGLTVVAFGTSAPELAVSLQSALSQRADIALGNVVGSNIFNVLLILGISAAITPLFVAQQLVRLDVPLMIGASLTVALFGLDGRLSRVEGSLWFAALLAYVGFAVWQSRKESGAVREEYEAEYAGGRRALSALLGYTALILAGLALLVLGARFLVDSAVTVARALGLSELVIGLTLVAGGTSLPEVAASVMAAARGERDIAVGNVVGSNLFNILGVLGLASAVSPGGIAVTSAALRFDVPVMIAVAVACLPIFASGNRIDRWEAFLFLAYYAAYTTYLIFAATAHGALGGFSWTMLAFVLPLTVVTLAIMGYRSVRERR
jgi:cation:H+ antiporter